MGTTERTGMFRWVANSSSVFAIRDGKAFGLKNM